MKKQIVIQTLLVILISFNAFSQNQFSGVYLTFNDYLNNKMAYQINCNTEKHKIKMNEFIVNKSYITVKHNDQKINLGKDSIFGMIHCGEPLMRFHDKEDYYLAEKGSLWIFYKDETQIKVKTPVTERKYYFSVKGDGAIMYLSNENVKHAFSDNKKVQEMVDAQFGKTDIAEFDQVRKMFKVNYFMKQIGQK